MTHKKSRINGIEYPVNDRGGCYPRLDPYGSAIGVSYE